MAMCEYLLPLGTPRHLSRYPLSVSPAHSFPLSPPPSSRDSLTLKRVTLQWWYCSGLVSAVAARRLPHNQQQISKPSADATKGTKRRSKRLGHGPGLTASLFVRNQETNRSPTSDDDGHASFQSDYYSADNSRS